MSRTATAPVASSTVESAEAPPAPPRPTASKPKSTRITIKPAPALVSAKPVQARAAAPATAPARGGRPRQVPIDSIQPNPYQPRRVFDGEALDELMSSIRQHGILQPLLVRERGEGFELIAGERRLRASRRLGLTTVPVVLRESPDDQLLELALIENVQREDLNPIEKARAFRKLMLLGDLTHEQLAQRVGRRRSSVSNFLRLLNLPEAIQRHVSAGRLSMGHARALLSLPAEREQKELAGRAISENLSVRQLEAAVRAQHKARRKPAPQGRSPWLRDLEDSLQRRLGTKVRIAQKKNQSGQITIEFYGEDDFERLLELLQG